MISERDFSIVDKTNDPVFKTKDVFPVAWLGTTQLPSAVPLPLAVAFGKHGPHSFHHSLPYLPSIPTNRSNEVTACSLPGPVIDTCIAHVPLSCGVTEQRDSHLWIRDTLRLSLGFSCFWHSFILMRAILTLIFVEILLPSFMSTRHQLDSFWKREPQLGKCFHWIGLFSSL